MGVFEQMVEALPLYITTQRAARVLSLTTHHNIENRAIIELAKAGKLKGDTVIARGSNYLISTRRLGAVLAKLEEYDVIDDLGEHSIDSEQRAATDDLLDAILDD